MRFFLFLVAFWSVLSPFAAMHSVAQNTMPSSTAELFSRGDDPTDPALWGDTDLVDLTVPNQELDDPSVADAGQFQIRFIVERVIDALKRFMIPIAMVLVSIAGVQLMAARNDSQQIETSKQTLIGMFFGFILFSFAVTMVDFVFFGQQGEIALTDETATTFAKRFPLLILDLFEWASTFVVATSVLFSVLGAYQLLVAQGSEEAMTQAKNRITWGVIGILTIIVGRPLYRIVTSDGGRLAIPDSDGLIELIVGWTNYLLGAVAFLAFVALVVGGLRLMLSFGDESASATAKNTILGAGIALIISISAYSIITFFAGAFG